MIGAYTFLTKLAGPLVRRHISRRATLGKEDPDRLNERFGQPKLDRPAGNILWVHGASVGETVSVLPLIEILLEQNDNLFVVVTSGTVTSAQLMSERLPSRAIHQYVPVDTPTAIAGFLDHWQPDGAIWVESELWPNLLLATNHRSIPMVLVNGRMSAKSFSKWRMFHKGAQKLLRVFRVCLAQSQADADRLRQLGAADVRFLGNLKDMAYPLPYDSRALDLLDRAIGERLTWLAASTHPGEEEQIFKIHMNLRQRFPGILTLLAPRHPERGLAIAEMAGKSGLATARRSLGDLPNQDTDIYLVDTLGELGICYRVCDLAFIGGTLVQVGGHNPMEPARIGVALVFGPHMENFTDGEDRLLSAGAALKVPDSDQLEDSIAVLIADNQQRATMISAGQTASQLGQASLVVIAELIGAEVLPTRRRGGLHAGS